MFFTDKKGSGTRGTSVSGINQPNDGKGLQRWFDLYIGRESRGNSTLFNVTVFDTRSSLRPVRAKSPLKRP